MTEAEIKELAYQNRETLWPRSDRSDAPTDPVPFARAVLAAAGAMWNPHGMKGVRVYGDKSVLITTDSNDDARWLCGEVVKLIEKRAVMTFEKKLQHQRDAEFHAFRSGFIVRAAMMFNVPCSEVTNAQYDAAYQATLRDTMPKVRPGALDRAMKSLDNGGLG